MTMLPLVACTGEENPSGNGNGNGNEGGNSNGTGNGGSQSEIICPASVRAGADGVIQWDGFADGDELSAVSKEGDEYALEVDYVTSSGMGFTVPVDVPAGKYMLVLIRAERKELGEIEITAPAMPITGLSVPAQSLAGEEVLISGVGYKQGCIILFTDNAGFELKLDAVVTNDGVTVTLPEDMPVGSYDVYLLQDNLEWLLKSGFAVIEEVIEVVEKDLVELRSYSPAEDEEMTLITWNINRADPVTLTLSKYTVSAGVETFECNDVYVADGEYSLVLEEDGFEITNNLEMDYMLTDGVVTGAEVLRYGKQNPTHYDWSYDSDGYLTDIVLPGGTLYTLSYESGNLTYIYGTRFEYSDPLLVNAANAPDVVWAYVALRDRKESAAYFPYLLGWYDKTSAQLPTMMYLPDTSNPDGTGEIACQLTYDFDSDGYVSKMSWNQGGSAYWIEFVY